MTGHNVKAIFIVLFVLVSGVATVVGLEYVNHHEGQTVDKGMP